MLSRISGLLAARNGITRMYGRRGLRDRVDRTKMMELNPDFDPPWEYDEIDDTGTPNDEFYHPAKARRREKQPEKWEKGRVNMEAAQAKMEHKRGTYNHLKQLKKGAKETLEEKLENGMTELKMELEELKNSSIKLILIRLKEVDRSKETKTELKWTWNWSFVRQLQKDLEKLVEMKDKIDLLEKEMRKPKEKKNTDAQRIEQETKDGCRELSKLDRMKDKIQKLKRVQKDREQESKDTKRLMQTIRGFNVGSTAQLELQAARRAAKQAKAEALKAGQPIAQQGKLSPEEIEKRRFLRREWVATSSATSAPARRTRIVTWNLLAQTLVRRELFPGSDCLRWGDRKPMILAELEHYAKADILCFQECDRLKDFLPALPGHSYVETKGHGKLHGLVVMYRTARYRVRASKNVYLDEEELNPSTSDSTEDVSDKEKRRRRGGTRKTKNVGVVVALEDVEKPNEGILVSTAHLFWHPKFAYERVRQVIILLRNLISFRKEHSCEDWPAVMTGDFNTQPDEATYQLLTNPHQPLPTEITQDVIHSRFVHKSLDAQYAPAGESPSADQSVAGTGTVTPVEVKEDKDNDDYEDEAEGEGEEELPDTDERSVAGTRPAQAADGILEMEDLVRLAQGLLPDGGLQSAYTAEKWMGENDKSYGQRGGFARSFGEGAVPEGVTGHDEPGYTCYTPLFKLTLDYLLILPSPKVQVTELLRPGTTEELGEGLPRKGISASDHVAVGCEIAW